MNKPQWIVIGIQAMPGPEGGVAILASKAISGVTLDAQYDHPSLVDDGRVVRNDAIYTIEATMKDFVIVYGSTYEEAFRRLFNTWDPNPEPMPYHPIVNPVRREIEGEVKL